MSNIPIVRALALLLAMPLGLHALYIESPTPARNFLFNGNWNPSPLDGSTQSRNDDSSFAGAGYDLSSVGWISGLGNLTTRANHVTLIAPSHVFQAKHMAVNALQPGKKLHFVGTNSIVTSTTVETLHQYLADSSTDAHYPYLYSNDLAVARVSRALTADENVSIARLLDLPTRTYGHSPPLLVTGSSPDTSGTRVALSYALSPQLPSSEVPIQVRFGAGQIAWYGIRFKDAAAAINPTCPSGFAVTAQSGDSGSPAFFPYSTPGGQKSALFAGSHWGFNQLVSVLPTPLTFYSPDYRSDLSTPYGVGFYNPVTPLNKTLRTYGYALKWTIADAPLSETLQSVTAIDNSLPVASNDSKWIQGMPVVASGVSGLNGLANGSTYWVIRVTNSSIRLAATMDDVRNSTPVSINGSGSVTLTHLNTASVWTGGADKSLGNASNWRKAPGVPSPASPATTYSANATRNFEPALFDASVSSGATSVEISSPLGLRGILFKTSSTPGGFTFNGTAPLAIDYSGIRNESTSTQTFNVPVILTASQNWEAEGGALVLNSPISFAASVPAGTGDDTAHVLVIGGSKDTTFEGVLSGNGSLAKDDAGTLTLKAANTYAGDTFVHRGTLALGPAGSLPQNSRLRFVASNPAIVDLNNRPHTFSQISSELTNGSTGEIQLGSGSGGGLVVNATTNATFSGRITGRGNLTKQGAATWTVGGVENTGAVNVTGGTLVINGPVGPDATPLTLSGGAKVVFSGNASMPYFSTVIDSSRRLAPGSPIGTLETGSQTWADGGEYTWQISSASGSPGSDWDFVRIANGALTLGSAMEGFILRLVPAGMVAGWNSGNAYTWKIAESPGGIVGFSTERIYLDTSAFSAVHPLQGGVFSIRQSGSALYLDFTPGLPGDFSPGAGSVVDGLVAFWTMSETSGATVADSSRAGTLRPLTITNSSATTRVNGKFDSALDFNGGSTTGATFSCPELGAISFSAWVWQDTRGNFPRILELGGYKVLIRSDWNSIGFNSARSSTAGDWRSDSVISTGSWQHLAVTFNGSSSANTPSIYLNGVKQGTIVVSAPNGTSLANAGTGFIGNRGDGTRPFDGKIDQVRIYNRVLSDGEIARLYSDNGLASPELISTAPVAGGIEIRWTATAGSGITYKVARASSLQGPFEFIGTPVSTLSFLDSSASPQQTYFYNVTAGSAGIGGPPSQVLTATAWSRLESWRANWFGSPNATTTSSLDADPDKDGSINLLEYATAGDPLAPDGPELWMEMTSAQHSLGFHRIADPDLTYEVQASTNLLQWTPVWTSQGTGNTYGPVAIPDLESNGSKRFFRLKVNHSSD